MDKRVLWAGVLTAVAGGCVVSTDTVPGEIGPQGDTGPQGDAGPKGDSFWKQESGRIYYEDPTTAEKLAIVANSFPSELDDPQATMTIGSRLADKAPGAFIKLGFGHQDGTEKSYAAIGASTDGTQGTMVFGVAGLPQNGGNSRALTIGKYGVVETGSNLVVKGSLVLDSNGNDGGAFLFGSSADGSNDIGLYAGGLIERMTITNTGLVGIGNTAPSQELDVTGDAHISEGLEVDQAAIIGADLHVKGAITADMGVCCSSDARLKKHVAPLPDALSRLLRLRGVTYEWREPDKHGHLTGPQTGMIAQEVEKVFPEWVGTNREGFKTLNLRGFEALAVESFRELKTENNTLRREVAALTSKADRTAKLEADLAAERAARQKLEARLTAIEAKLAAPVRPSSH